MDGPFSCNRSHIIDEKHVYVANEPLRDKQNIKRGHQILLSSSDMTLSAMTQWVIARQSLKPGWYPQPFMFINVKKPISYNLSIS